MMFHASVLSLMGFEEMPKMGGTYFTRRKVARGGFQGRYSAGNKTILLGMEELNLFTR